MKNIDYKLFFTVVSLLIFGVIMISSVSVFQSFKVTSDMAAKGQILEPYNFFYLLRSLGHIVISLILMGLIIKTPYKFFEKNAKYFLSFAIFLLIFVLVRGMTIKGATGWINIPGIPFTIQPTEFLKISLILFLAVYFKKNYHLLYDFKKGFLAFFGIISLVAIMVGAQPDFGTLMVLIPVTVMMFFYAGANKKHIFGLFTLGIIFFIGVYSAGDYDKKTGKITNKLGYITQRVDNFLFTSNEELFKTVNIKGNDKRTDQTKQGLITIGSGGLSGKGFGESIQKFGYLPEVQGDFIFAVIVEELGFRGGLILIIFYLFIGYRGFFIAYNVKDNFCKFTALGITSRILWQTFINIGVNLNVVPLTGVTLPFISYGGSSMLSLSIAVGILLTISREVEEKPAYARMSKQKFIF